MAPTLACAGTGNGPIDAFVDGPFSGPGRVGKFGEALFGVRIDPDIVTFQPSPGWRTRSKVRSW